MSLSDQVKALRTAIDGLGEDLTTLDDVRSKVRSEEGALKELKAQRDALQAEQNSVKYNAEHDLAESRKALEIAKNDVARELAATNASIERAKAKLAEIDNQVQAKLAHHDQIEASLESLRKKLG